jgi:hypothetical protein
LVRSWLCLGKQGLSDHLPQHRPSASLTELLYSVGFLHWVPRPDKAAYDVTMLTTALRFPSEVRHGIAAVLRFPPSKPSRTKSLSIGWESHRTALFSRAHLILGCSGGRRYSLACCWWLGRIDEDTPDEDHAGMFWSVWSLAYLEHFKEASRRRPAGLCVHNVL